MQTKVCSLLEWCYIISIDTCWDWFQLTYVLNHRMEEFIIALANYVVSQGVRITFRPDIFLSHFTIDDINYQLNSSIYVATGCHCYVALIKTGIHLTAFDRLGLQLHGAIYRPDSFVLTLRYCTNLKAIRYESTSLNRIVADKSHRVIAA